MNLKVKYIAFLVCLVTMLVSLFNGTLVRLGAALTDISMFDVECAIFVASILGVILLTSDLSK